MEFENVLLCFTVLKQSRQGTAQEAGRKLEAIGAAGTLILCSHEGMPAADTLVLFLIDPTDVAISRRNAGARASQGAPYVCLLRPWPNRYVADGTCGAMAVSAIT